MGLSETASGEARSICPCVLICLPSLCVGVKLTFMISTSSPILTRLLIHHIYMRIGPFLYLKRAMQRMCRDGGRSRSWMRWRLETTSPSECKTEDEADVEDSESSEHGGDGAEKDKDSAKTSTSLLFLCVGNTAVIPASQPPPTSEVNLDDYKFMVSTSALGICVRQRSFSSGDSVASHECNER